MSGIQKSLPPHDLKRTLLRVIVRGSLAIAVLLLLFSPVQAQLPATQLGSVFPAGGAIGQTVEVTIGGADLDDAKELKFSHPGITAQQKMADPGPFDKGPVPVPNQFVVAIAVNVPVGLYDVRVLGKYGISNPRAFSVGDLNEAVEVEPNNTQEQAVELTLPITVNGLSNQPGDVDWYKMTVAAGQRILIDCDARRIDSRMDSVITILDTIGRVLTSNRDGDEGDPLLDFTAPAAGDYFVKVNDALFAGSTEYGYRMSIGTLTYVDFIFPPAGLPGTAGPFTVYGRNLPGGQPAGISVRGKPLEKLSVSFPLPGGAAAETLNFNGRIDPELAGLDGAEFRQKGAVALSNPALIGIATAPVVIETEPNNRSDQAQVVTVPCEIAGQFYPQRDDDWFSFAAKQGDVLAIEVISQRLGLPTDPSLVIEQVTQDAEGKQLVTLVANVDDNPTMTPEAEFDVRNDDPVYRLVVPADATYRILVRDSYSYLRDDPRNIYRLSIRKEQPDFRLAAVPATPNGVLHLRKGGSEAINVVVFRRDEFDGEVTVTATGLPAGVTCPPVIVGPGRTSATLVLTAADGAAAANALIQVVGKATIGAAEVTRAARAGTVIWPLAPRQNNQQPQVSGESRVSREIAVSVSAEETAPLLLTAGADKVWESSRAGIVKVPFSGVRRGGYNGPVIAIAKNLPANSNSPPVTINGDVAAGEIVLNLTATTPVGTYTIYLDNFAQNVPYSRNPEAAATAAARKVEIDKINTDAAAAAKIALDAKTVADKAAVDAAAVVKAATDAKAAADKAAADAAAELKVATEKAAQAKAAAAAAPGDANLAAASVAADKVVVDATAKVKAANDAVVVAQKALDDAIAKAKVADEAKVKTDKANEDAVALAAAAVAAKTATDKLAVDTANAAKPVNRNVFFPSTTFTLKITPAPITLAATAPAAALKQGEMVEVPIKITRLYEYANPVAISAVLPGGVGGLNIPNATIAQGQVDSKLVISAAANATPGMHELIVRATVNLNNQNLIVDQPIKLEIAEVKPTN